MVKRRVAVVGIGLVTPLGTGVEEFWRNLTGGRSGLGPCGGLAGTRFSEHVTAPVRAFPEDERESRVYSRQTRFALAAAREALSDSGYGEDVPERTDVILGSGSPPFDAVLAELDRNWERRKAGERPRTDPFTLSKTNLATSASALALLANARGYVTTHASSCVSGLDAVGHAASRIGAGEADLAIAGATETPLNEIMLEGLHGIRYLASDGNGACPFDLKRSKGVLGEGAGIFVLEDLESARGRGARVHGEILSYAQGAENVNEMFPMERSGRRWAEIIRRTAGRRKVDCIIANGPGHVTMDKIENEAIKLAFGEEARNIPITSIKGAVGSSIAATGVIQLATAALVLRHGRVPHICNYRTRDPDLDLNFVHTKSRKGDIRRVLVNVHGMGGLVAAILLGKPQGFDMAASQGPK